MVFFEPYLVNSSNLLTQYYVALILKYEPNEPIMNTPTVYFYLKCPLIKPNGLFDKTINEPIDYVYLDSKLSEKSSDLNKYEINNIEVNNQLKNKVNICSNSIDPSSNITNVKNLIDENQANINKLSDLNVFNSSINSSGRKKALLIGINYFNTRYELKGCINDVINMKQFLNETYQFPLEGMVLLTDNQLDNPSRMPTKLNIIKAMQWLVDGARENDSLFLHFSGHGNQVLDLDFDELDGFDETLCPVDFLDQGQLLDDDLNLILVQSLPKNCKLTVIFDSCHSGTALDLPFIYTSNGKLKSYDKSKLISNTFDQFKSNQLDLIGAFRSIKSNYIHIKKVNQLNLETKTSLANVVMFSSCKDDEKSVDEIHPILGNLGALSCAFIQTLKSKRDLTYLDVLNEIRMILNEKGFLQQPQLSTSKLMDMNLKFLV